MAKWHGISRRKPSGGRLKRPSRYRGKRKTEISSENQFAFVGDKDARKLYRKTAGSQTGSITLDFDTYQNFVLTATGNVTLANPTTESVGQSGIIVFVQDGTGSRTLSLGTDYETAGGAGLTISTAASAVDVIPYFVKASGSIQLGAPQLAFA